MKMSKELEALEFICKILKEKGIDIKWLFKEQYNTIKQRLESIDNANPSEALDGLQHIKKRYIPQYCSIKTCNYLEIIEQALIKAQEQEKVLNAIFSKNLFEPTHKYIVGYSKDYANYCKLFGVYKLDEVNKLTEEEFNTLKEYANEITRVKN